jgi:hypothetical protein
MLDLHSASFGRGYLYNGTVLSEHTVGYQSSRRDIVRGSAYSHPGLVRGHCQPLESPGIAVLIMSESSHAIALVLSEPTVNWQSLHI